MCSQVATTNHAQPALGPAQGGNQFPQTESAAPSSFVPGCKVVYPSRGLGVVKGLTSINDGGTAIPAISIRFPDSRSMLWVPLDKVQATGLRRLADPAAVERAIEILRGRARTSRGIWSRRAQAFHDKIKAGSLESLAEVVRDLQPKGASEQPYSQRMIFEEALGRLADEIAAIELTTQDRAIDKIMALLASSRREPHGNEGELLSADTTIETAQNRVHT